jgi:hypothetical protein
VDKTLASLLVTFWTEGDTDSAHGAFNGQPGHPWRKPFQRKK